MIAELVDDSSFRKLLKQYHPDHNPTKSAQKITDEIIRAHNEYRDRSAKGILRPIGMDGVIAEKNGVLFLNGRTIYPIFKAKYYTPHFISSKVQTAMAPVLPSKIQLHPYGLEVNHARNVYSLALISWTDPRDSAWIMSSMLNLCCWLHSERIVLKSITRDCLAVDADKHDIHLIGGWDNYAVEGDNLSPVTKQLYDLLPFSIKRDKKATSMVNVIQMKTMIPLSGNPIMDDFLKNSTEDNAVAEYAKWQNVILPKVFGKRTFFKEGLTMKIHAGMPAEPLEDEETAKVTDPVTTPAPAENGEDTKKSE